MNLRAWQKNRLAELRNAAFAKSRYFSDLTLVVYSFPDDVDGDAFDWIECAVLQSWAVLGMLKTVIVVHRHFEKVNRFLAQYPEWIDVQVESSLLPGNIDSMSEDCDSRLHSRFNTSYCLIVQDDGFPLKDMLDDFIGKFDFIGAPYVRVSWWKNIICRILGMWVSNGGFSLRSKRICEAASYWWQKKYYRLHPSELTVEDLYYTQTLPLRHPSYRMKFKIADNRTALRFSYDDIVTQPLEEKPMGFHRASTFYLLDIGKIY